MNVLPTRGEISKANGFVKFANCSIKPVQLHTSLQLKDKWSGITVPLWMRQGVMLMVNIVPGTNI